MRLRSLWAGSCTLLGFLLAGLLAVRAGGAHWQRLDGVWECTLRRPLRLPFEAIALGELVIAVDSQAMQRLRRHERVHVEQARRWGPLFLAAYPLGAWAAEIQARVSPAMRVRLGVARRPGWYPGQAVQRRIAPIAGLTQRAGASCGAIRCCRLVVGADPTPRRRLGWPRNWPRRGPGFLPPTLLASLWCWLQGRRPYFDNPFEEQARRLGG